MPNVSELAREDEARAAKRGTACICKGGYDDQCYQHGLPSHGREPAEANAKLIAAAPDMASALERSRAALQVMADNAQMTPALRKEVLRIVQCSRDALAKAGL